MKLCVGATSRRVVEEAAKWQVHQIVASNNQVGPHQPGYAGYDGPALVNVVNRLSDGQTEVVRDHGGPGQVGTKLKDRNWADELEADVSAGFDGIHIDVSALPLDDQLKEQRTLCARFAERVDIEVGGERNIQPWNHDLLADAWVVCDPRYAVVSAGGHIWADRQVGRLTPPDALKSMISEYSHNFNVLSKAHNFDWVARSPWRDSGLHAYNLAPELANVEVDAWLHTLTLDHVKVLLDLGWQSKKWQKWFHNSEGTWFEQARCGLRYLLEQPKVARVLDEYDDSYVREQIRNAIKQG